MRRPIVAGNWKMNGLSSSIAELDSLMKGYSPELAARVDLLLCPPFTLIEEFAAAAAGSHILIGAQDCHPKPSGAHTGDVSAEMLADSGARAVIVGHSERRASYGERDELVRAKAEAASRAGLMAVICVGETAEERENGQTLEIVGRQLKGSIPDGASAERVIVAYEPVWAIGTGKTPTVGDIAEVHGLIRQEVSARLGKQAGEAMRILYGGSVKPDNARTLLTTSDVDGALVGGASLLARDFLAIAESYAGL